MARKSRLEREYTREIKGWDWEGIKASALANTHEDEEGQKVGAEYLGSVFSIMPSGKYYMPFAASNVAGDCRMCKGTGKLPNQRTECTICHGGGTRTAGEGWVTLEWARELAGESIQVGDKIPCNACQGVGSFAADCPACGGSGSRSAHTDEVFREILESIASEHGMWIENGEGDPTDLFACMLADEEEEEEEGV
jgi:hypothetical protein